MTREQEIRLEIKKLEDQLLRLRLNKFRFANGHTPEMNFHEYTIETPKINARIFKLKSQLNRIESEKRKK